MKKVIIALCVCVCASTVSAVPQTNTYGSAVPIVNNMYNADTGTIQATIVGRGITTPQTNTFGSIVPMFNFAYNHALGALQIYLDASSISELDHGGLGGLTPDNDHPQYWLLTGSELSADPADPAEGSTVCWTSDGTETGIDGEQVCKVTAGSVTVTWFPPFSGTGTEWNDVNIGGMSLGGPASGRPDAVVITSTGGASTGIYTLGFDTSEKASGILEIPHSYKEGTDLSFHIHWSGNDAPSGTDKVKWQLEYVVVADDTVVPAVTTIVIEADYDTQYERVTTNFPTITGTAFVIGDQFAFTLERISASANEYAGDALLFTTGFHFESDTVGSRDISSK